MAQDFVAGRTFLNHHVDDQTGFSALLTRDAASQYTLSFRSLEFRDWAQAGDWERDGAWGAAGGIASMGFAIGQIASMRRYFDGLVASGQIPAGTKVDVTGYSLGGHLASVFTLMYPEWVNKTTTFNAAGHGNIDNQIPTGAALRAMVDDFTQALEHPEAVSIGSIGGLSDEARQTLQLRQGAAQSKWSLNPSWAPFASETLTSKTPITKRDSMYGDTRYIFATEYLLAKWNPKPVTPSLPGNPAGDTPTASAVYGNLITQLFGMATHDDSTIVANSQRHSDNTVRIFVEDQPDAYGNVLNTLPKVFGDKSGFGGTHNLALMIDSLSTIAAFQSIAPGISMETVQGLLAASSNQRASGDFTGGLAEGDSLENAIDALRLLLASADEVASFRRLEYERLNDGFGKFDDRTNLHKRLNEIKTALEGAGGISLQTFVPELGNTPVGSVLLPTLSATELFMVALTDEGARYALRELNAFALTGESLYGRFTHGELSLEGEAAGAGQLTSEYLEDRAKFLYQKLVLNLNNLNNDISEPINGNPESVPSGLPPLNNAQFFDVGTGYLIRRSSDETTPWYVFGTASNDGMSGGQGNDRLHGGGGADVMVGAGGSDQLWGGSGKDTLYGDRQATDDTSDSSGADILRGGAGNDQLYGGAGRDELYGDIGADRLYGGYGADIVQGGAGADTLYGGAGADTALWGGDGDDTIYGDGIGPADLDGADVIDGGAGMDRLYGGGGTDSIRGGAGADLLKGDSGNDTLEGGSGSDQLWGGLQDDNLYGNEGSDELLGEAGADWLYGGAGADALGGGDDADHLFGEAGMDVLDVGWGDVVDGGTDYDTYLLNGFGGAAGPAAIIADPDNDGAIFGGSHRIAGIFRQRGDRYYNDDANEIDPAQPAPYFKAEVGGMMYYDGADRPLFQIAGFANDGYDIYLRPGSGAGATLTTMAYGDIAGTEQDDTITAGGVGARLFDGGKGNDTLIGGAQSDTYVFRLGDGNDLIHERFDGGTGDDTIRIYGVSRNDARLVRLNEDAWYGSPRFLLMYSPTDSVSFDSIGQIVFDDGTGLANPTLDFPHFDDPEGPRRALIHGPARVAHATHTSARGGG